MDPLKRDYLQKWKDVRIKYDLLPVRLLFVNLIQVWERLSKESQQRHSESYKILQELCQR